MEAHERARAAIERWRQSEGDATAARWELPAEERPAIAWPSLDPETFLAAELEPAERGAAAAHVARARFDRALAPFRQERERQGAGLLEAGGERRSVEETAQLLLDAPLAGAAARALEPLGRSLAARAEEARREALAEARRWLEAIRATPHPDGGPAAEDRRRAAHALLDASDTARSTLRGRLGVGELWQWPLALRGDRALFRPEQRFQRIAADVEGWGLRPVLAQHVRVAPQTPSLVRARLAVRRAPGRIRLAGPSVDGVAGEVLAAEGLGRALGLALVSPGAPAPLRWPVTATVSRALGMLLAQVACDPIALRRRGLMRKEARAAAAVGAAHLIVRARIDAAGVLAEGCPLEERAPLLSRALGVPADPGAAFLLATSAASPRFRASASALALFVALRERFDEDFFRNPHASGPIRGAAARGGAFSAEAFVQELGGDAAAAEGRLGELAEHALA